MYINCYYILPALITILYPIQGAKVWMHITTIWGTTSTIDAQAKDFKDDVEDALHILLKQSNPLSVERT